MLVSSDQVASAHIQDRLAPLSPVIRALTANDVTAIRGMLTALDLASRCARFGWASSDAALAKHAGELAVRTTTLGAFIDRELCGILEIYGGGNPRSVEVAVVVDKRWRRRGLGRAMLDAALSWAKQNGTGSVCLIFSRHNWPMRRLVASACASLDIVMNEIWAEIGGNEAIRPPA